MNGEIVFFDLILLSVVGLLELAFGIYLIVRYVRTSSIVFFALFVFFLSLWVLTNAAAFVIPIHNVFFDIDSKLSFVFAILLFPALYLYVINFPIPTILINWRLILFVFTAPILLSTMILGSGTVVFGFDKLIENQPTIFGEAFWAYSFYMLFMYAIILFELIRQINKSKGSHRWYAQILFFAVFISGAIGLLFNLVLPSMFDIRIAYWIAPSSSIIWLALVWWATQRK
ncbi:MAG: hypothetical protein H6760_01310 [Candidatus Nomurabacteria bacterium]|nr:MAG: hypothetical protein H6760_01310 [Candidatus Nomurabacteria bacterium]